jgi:integrase
MARWSEGHRIDPFKVPNIDKMGSLFHIISDYEMRLFAICQYLAGARVSELCRYENKKTGKVHSGIRRADFWLEKRNNIQYIMVRRRVLKRKSGKKVYNIVPIPFHEKDPIYNVVKLLWDWVDKHDMDEELWPYKRLHVWIHLKPLLAELVKNSDIENKPKNLLRHIRVSHLRRYYNFDAFELQDLIGWADISTVTIYSHLDKSDLMRKLRGPQEESSH